MAGEPPPFVLPDPSSNQRNALFCSAASSGPFLRDYAPYIVERPLGRGGFGETVLAYHPGHPGHRVVLKVPHGTEHATRLLRIEAGVLRGLHHPRIVRFLEVVDNPVRDFIVMEFAAGGSLAQRLHGVAAVGLPAAEVARLVLDILPALEYVHLKGVLHLDVTPSNILLTTAGDFLLADFGLSRPSTDDSPFCAGTLPYIAPEVRVNSPRFTPNAAVRAWVPPVTAKADVWSAGVVLYEAVTGSPRGATSHDAAAWAGEGGAWTPPALPAGTPAALGELIRLMLTVDPKARPDCSALLLHPAALQLKQLVRVATAPAAVAPPEAPDSDLVPEASRDGLPPRSNGVGRADTARPREVGVVEGGVTAGSLRGTDPARVQYIRLAVTSHVVARAARTGRGLLPAYGLTLEQLSAAPPANVTIRVVEVTVAGGVKRESSVLVTGADAMRVLLAPRTAPGICVVIAAAGGGKTLLFNTISACHAAASLSAEELGRLRVAPPLTENSGLIKGAALRHDSADGYARIVVLRLRDFLKLDGRDSPFDRPDVNSVTEAAVWAIAELIGLTAIAGVTPRELGGELFGTDAPRTLWLLDGFDEAPGADAMAATLAAPMQAAFQEARNNKLAAPCNALAEVTFQGQCARGIATVSRLEAVLRVLLSQPHVALSSRPQFEARLAPLTGRANARFVRLEPLAPEAVEAFVAETLKDDPRGLRNVELVMSGSTVLREHMRTPVLMLIAIATYRHGSEVDSAGHGGVGIEDSSHASRGGAADLLSPAPGGPTDAQLADIDIRAPIAGLYVRLERLLAKQVWEQHLAASDSEGVPHEDRSIVWRRLRNLLGRAALMACSKPGSTRVDWPADASEGDRMLLYAARIVMADACGGLEFPHRSIQEYFCAVAVLKELAGGLAPPMVSAQTRGTPRTAWDIFVKWYDEKLAGAPREVVLTVLLSPTSSAELKQWALTNTDWGHMSVILQMKALTATRARFMLDDAVSPSDTLIQALSDPANDVLRQLTMSLVWRSSPAVCNSIVAAMAAGCESTTLCDFLGDCLPFLPQGCACALTYRGLFETAAATLWDLSSASSVSMVQLLGHKFWAAVDALTAGAQARRALDAIRAAISPPQSTVPSDTVNRAAASAVILGSLSRMVSPELLAEAHSVLELASTSQFESIAAEATFAGILLEPLPGSVAPAVGLRERLLRLARPTSRSTAASPSIVGRAVAELARRFVGDAVVHAALKADLVRGSMTPFIEACVNGPGTPLVSSEIACVLFQWLEPDTGTRLAARIWDPLSDPEEAIADGLTPLHIAAARSRSDFIAVYAGQRDLGADEAINVESKSSCTPLSLAGTRTIRAPHTTVECAVILVLHGARWGRPCPRLTNALHAAAEVGSLNSVRRLLDAPGISTDMINSSNKDGSTPLHEAARNGHAEVVSELLDRGADVGAKDEGGSTPLHWAARYGHAAVALLLLDRGVDVGAKTNDGWTPIHGAAWKGHAAVASLLLDRGADVGAKNRTGSTPLHSAAFNGQAAMTSLLLDRGADVGARDNGGVAPADLARKRGMEDVLALLLGRS